MAEQMGSAGYFLLNAADAAPPALPAGLAEHSSGFAHQPLVGGRQGTVHTSTGISQLGPGGSLAAHLHSFEESFYVLEGAPVLDVGGASVEFGPTAAAWSRSGPRTPGATRARSRPAGS